MKAPPDRKTYFVPGALLHRTRSSALRQAAAAGWHSGKAELGMLWADPERLQRAGLLAIRMLPLAAASACRRYLVCMQPTRLAASTICRSVGSDQQEAGRERQRQEQHGGLQLVPQNIPSDACLFPGLRKMWSTSRGTAIK